MDLLKTLDEYGMACVEIGMAKGCGGPDDQVAAIEVMNPLKRVLAQRLAEAEFLSGFLAITARYEDYDSFYWPWRGDNSPLKIWVNCNDVFYWGSSDCDEVTPANLAELERAYKDAAAACQFGEVYGPHLFCARVRKMRPQGAAYPNYADFRSLWPLFDACGPERPIDACNPRKPKVP